MISLIVQSTMFFICCVIFIILTIAQTLKDIDKNIQKSNEVSKLKRKSIYDKEEFSRKR